MLCIKGFADPLCYLLSLLSPGLAQLLGRIKPPRCSKALLRARHLFSGTAWSPSWPPSSIRYTLARTLQGEQTLPRANVHLAASWRGRCQQSQLLAPLLGVSSALTWPQPALRSNCLCLILSFHVPHLTSCWTPPPFPRENPRVILWPCLLVIPLSVLLNTSSPKSLIPNLNFLSFSYL